MCIIYRHYYIALYTRSKTHFIIITNTSRQRQRMNVTNLIESQIRGVTATGIQTTDCGIQGAVETPTPGVLELRALGGAFPGDGHCRAVLTPIVNVRSYRASIILQNIRGDGQEDYGNIGLMYNVHDADNFDFILLRIR